MKVLAVSGLSCGHIFPAVSFLEHLQSKYKNTEALLVLPKTREVKLPRPDTYRVELISISNIKFRFRSSCIFEIWNFVKGSLESLQVLLKFRPDVVIGFGSLTSIPLILFAWLLRINTVLHEQNVVPGKANRLLAMCADKIAVSFRETKKYFQNYHRKIVFTGNPLRKEFKKSSREESSRYFGFDPRKFTLLVMGGSQGSHKINLEFLKCISLFNDTSRMQIIHLGGVKEYEALKTAYASLKADVRVYDFLQAMQYAYCAADLAISRAGATTIAELIFFELPAIIIPYPYAYAHQLCNAHVLEGKEAAIVFQEDNLDAHMLKSEIESCIGEPRRLEAMRLSLRGFSPTNGSDALVETVMSSAFARQDLWRATADVTG